MLEPVGTGGRYRIPLRIENKLRKSPKYKEALGLVLKKPGEDTVKLLPCLQSYMSMRLVSLEPSLQYEFTEITTINDFLKQDGLINCETGLLQKGGKMPNLRKYEQLLSNRQNKQMILGMKLGNV
jgi:hypothetical protein